MLGRKRKPPSLQKVLRKATRDDGPRRMTPEEQEREWEHLQKLKNLDGD